jgi:hypothetical protein
LLPTRMAPQQIHPTPSSSFRARKRPEG